ncbi:MAG: hypothetical protein QNL08_00640 [Ilumatobacteraceae bacterium]
MTTNQPTPTGTTRATKRSKHPARSARIISSGIALASTLGISSAYTLAAQAKTTGEQIQNNSILTLAQNVLATVPAPTAIAAPTQPAPAAAAPAAAPAPVVVNIAPPAPQVQWTPPASKGSK